MSVGAVDSFPAGAGVMAVVGRRHLAIFRLDGEFFAIDNLCLHQAGPLCEGEVEDGIVICPWHGWAYQIRTGILVQDGKVGVSCHEVRVVGGDVQVRVAD